MESLESGANEMMNEEQKSDAIDQGLTGNTAAGERQCVLGV